MHLSPCRSTLSRMKLQPRLQHKVFTHAVVHDGKVIGFARDLRYDGEVVTALARMLWPRPSRLPQRMVMHRSWLRPLRAESRQGVHGGILGVLARFYVTTFRKRTPFLGTL